jgi:hypothetical protein
MMDDTKMQLSGEDATFENDDLISRRAAIRLASGGCHPANVAKELAKLPPAQADLSGYSDRLWKNAYERGKAEAEIQKMQDLEQAEIQKAYELGKLDAMEEMPHWISCSERKPTKEGDYVVTLDYGDEQRISADMFIIPKKGEPFWAISDHVVAWVEGLDPYRQVTGKLDPDDRHCEADRDCIGGR